MQNAGLQVLVVWEPILPTDWGRPTTSVLARIHKAGVTQFWEHDHLVAREIFRELTSDPAGPKLRCCTSRGNLWDLAAIYPKGALWRETPPEPVFADGPVAHVQPGLQNELAVGSEEFRR